MGKMDSSKGVPLRTGGKIPAAGKADMSGERSGKIKGGVAQGKEDATGKDALFNTGRTEGVCYEHKREAYRNEDKYERD